MNITINEPPRSKKNSQQIVRIKGRPILVPSKAYKEYEKVCKPYLEGIYKKPIDYPVTVTCEYYMPTRRRVDLTNLMEATHDVLVKYGVLADDNRNIIASVDGSRVYYDKENPRTEIYITRYEGEYTPWTMK